MDRRKVIIYNRPLDPQRDLRPGDRIVAVVVRGDPRWEKITRLVEVLSKPVYNQAN